MMVETEFFCTDVAWEYGVPLIGTATRGDAWFLIEYAGRWGAKAFEESSIPEAVKKHLKAATHLEIRVRILLIRQPESKNRMGITFFAAQTQPLDPQLYEYHLDDYADLLSLDLTSLVNGDPGHSANLRDAPLYLVCTNGKRDKCCSIYGPETFEGMRKVGGQAVWQSSHIGGHNQAPITLFFPYGVNYGHTSPSEARRLVQAYQKGEIVLHHYRGRVCFENHVQAAEHFWREQKGVLSLPGTQVVAETQIGENQWAVTICGIDGENRETIQIERRESDFVIPITCAQTKSDTISSFHRI